MGSLYEKLTQAAQQSPTGQINLTVYADGFIRLDSGITARGEEQLISRLSIALTVQPSPALDRAVSEIEEVLWRTRNDSKH